MLEESGLIAAIDVGTTKVCTVIGRKDGDRGVQVIAHGVVPCYGLRKGNVADLAATESAVRRSVDELHSKFGHRVQSALVGVTGSHLEYENRRDRLPSVGQQGVITADDLRQEPEELEGTTNGHSRELIHAIRTDYSLDGKLGIRNPLGMHSSEVEVETHVVTGGVRLIDRLREAVENAGVAVDDMVLEPLVSGVAVLTAQEKEEGVLLVDIGGGTTDLVGFWRGGICYTGVIPVGGHQFTNDIAIIYNTTYEAAEEAKLRYASTELEATLAGREEVSLPVRGNGLELKVPQIEICQLTRERAHELTRLIKLKLEEVEDHELWARRIVLTGGASLLPGLGALIQRHLATPVRQGAAALNSGVPDEIKGPAFATSLGMLMWAASEVLPNSRVTKADDAETSQQHFISALLTRLKKLLPTAMTPSRKGRK